MTIRPGDKIVFKSFMESSTIGPYGILNVMEKHFGTTVTVGNVDNMKRCFTVVECKGPWRFSFDWILLIKRPEDEVEQLVEMLRHRVARFARNLEKI